MPVICQGIVMYNIQTTLKGVAAEAISMGESLYIHSDGLVYVVDNGKYDVCHGWALKDYAEGDKVTILTQCRMIVDTTQTVGARLYTGAVSGGSAPSTTLSATGVIVGFAVEAKLIYCRITVPGADG